MLERLLLTGQHKEAEVLAHTMAAVGGLLPISMQNKLSDWAQKLCSRSDLRVHTA